MAIRKPLKKGEDVEIVPTGEKFVTLEDQTGGTIRCRPKGGGDEASLPLASIRRVRTRATTLMIKR